MLRSFWSNLWLVLVDKFVCAASSHTVLHGSACNNCLTCWILAAVWWVGHPVWGASFTSHNPLPNLLNHLLMDESLKHCLPWRMCILAMHSAIDMPDWTQNWMSCRWINLALTILHKRKSRAVSSVRRTGLNCHTLQIEFNGSLTCWGHQNRSTHTSTSIPIDYNWTKGSHQKKPRKNRTPRKFKMTNLVYVRSSQLSKIDPSTTSASWPSVNLVLPQIGVHDNIFHRGVPHCASQCSFCLWGLECIFPSFCVYGVPYWSTTSSSR